MAGATRTAFAGMWRHSLRWRLRWGVAFLFFFVVSGTHAGERQGTGRCANFLLPRDVSSFYDHIRDRFKSGDANDVWASFCQGEDKKDRDYKDDLNSIRKTIIELNEHREKEMQKRLGDINQELLYIKETLNEEFQLIKKALNEERKEREEEGKKEGNGTIKETLIKTITKQQTVQELKDAVLKTIVIELTKPKDCSDLLANGESKSGVHTIHPYNGHSARVFCDMESDGGGWTVFLARMNQSEQLNFTRKWDDYKNGFGSPEWEYWLGNENLHRLTSGRNYSVRIDAEDDEEKNWVKWKTFKVESESEKYRLTLGDQMENSTVHGQLLSDNDGFKFSTFDQVNDIYAEPCGERHTGGWWYGLCSSVQTLSIYGPPGDHILRYWTPFNYSIPFGRTSLHLKISLTLKGNSIK